jgi:hypothetical protein
VLWLALDGEDWDCVYLGRRKGPDLVYAGKVDHGFDKASAKLLRARLTPLIRKSSPIPRRLLMAACGSTYERGPRRSHKQELGGAFGLALGDLTQLMPLSSCLDV